MLLQNILDALIAYAHWLVPFAVLAWFLRNKYGYGIKKYPGPVVAAWTDWYKLYWGFQRTVEKEHQRLHKVHGDVVRIGPRTLSFADPQAIKDIYGLGKGFYKSDYYTVPQSTAAGQRVPTLFSSTDEDFHSKFKRCVNNAFAMSTLVSFEPLVDSTSKVFLEKTQQRFCDTGEACDLGEWLQYYAFDVIGEISWSKRLGFVETGGDVENIIANIDDFHKYSSAVGQMPVLDWAFFDKNPIKMFLARHGLWNSGSAVANFALDRMRERKPLAAGEGIEKTSPAEADVTDPEKQDSTGPKRGVDFLSRFRKAQQEHPEFMTDARVLAASVSLIVAGSDSTGVSLTAIFYFLMRNPDCYDKLMAELDAIDRGEEGQSTPGRPDIVSWADAQKLSYLDAVIQETFRVFPAAGILLERHVPQGGAIVCGEHIPAGTIVGCNAWVLHQRREVFGDDVEAFRPERWLDADAVKLKEMKSSMFHFGAGSRTCIGRNISMLEVYKLVPTFLRKFELEMEQPENDIRTKNCFFVHIKDLKVRIKPRTKPE
ncbi:MAG: hypothetical protein M1828_002116 [Chrysothrix sp. TS-e1954]|nr:MAG: hypothetical protein M1828_002116 [Chrysothrix sp. TS-e1954]